MCQSQCGGPPSQAPYPSSAWWAVTRTNYLMGRSPLPQPRKFPDSLLNAISPCGISSPFGLLSPAEGQVSYVLRTRSPLSYC